MKGTQLSVSSDFHPWPTNPIDNNFEIPNPKDWLDTSVFRLRSVEPSAKGKEVLNPYPSQTPIADERIDGPQLRHT